VKVIFGLGNPGRQYDATRHNVGWMVLDRIAARSGWSGRARERDAAASARGRVGDLDLLLVKPLTFMNDSGIAVRKILARERVKMEDVLVVADDFALPFGRLRVRASGTAGGHNGLRSIIGEMGTQDFARLRVGIGEPRRDAVDHVLSRFAPAEGRLLPDLLDAAADAVEAWARDGAAAASNRWNPWLLPGVEPARPSPRPAPARSGTRRSGDGSPGGAGTPDERGDADPEHADSTAPLGEAAGPNRVRGGGESGASELDGESAAGAAGPDVPEHEEIGAPGPDGIRRTRTGWRRVLDRLGDSADDRRWPR
jgi:PTH1 family peptidyl-tRNA hydrolase